MSAGGSPAARMELRRGSWHDQRLRHWVRQPGRVEAEDIEALRDGSLEQSHAMLVEWRCAFPVVVRNGGTEARLRREQWQGRKRKELGASIAHR